MTQTILEFKEYIECRRAELLAHRAGNSLAFWVGRRLNWYAAVEETLHCSERAAEIYVDHIHDILWWWIVKSPAYEAGAKYAYEFDL